MKKHLLTVIVSAISLQSFSQTASRLIKEKDVENIINVLAADSMEGRGIFTPGIEKAARYIENSFKTTGLESFSGSGSFRQNFSVTKSVPLAVEVNINNVRVPVENCIIISNGTFKWNNDKDVQVLKIKPGGAFLESYLSILRSGKNAIVQVDEQYRDYFNHLRKTLANGCITLKNNNPSGQVFILGNAAEITSFEISYQDKTQEIALSNIIGVIPGKTRPKECVIFSGHYDHLGILPPVKGDSIANGADDDASGITGVISLAKYYKKLNNNARTLIFIAFTAEELGEWGSQYLSTQLDPDKIVAMINMELIGSDSKFGPNNAFITGFERSDFGAIMQKNIKDTSFQFHPDPYVKFELFYRSDNASLARLGVPAHTISTAPIDKDQFYHTVKDEVKTLDLKSLTATIQAIATGAGSLVSGRDTPTRIK
ncbi:M28 family metallopeptidase [Mucilaginibacter phenanthrenivorans]|uniref:M28 family metallopeptidase n=1 Tax=Mucilaginibacter phenanthrenivorans TaxID=1234842 RepID=UPI002157D6E1|nr:M20/M25/M40 family metallo-hydrolase [Mucilaginibacter phenanthrenivorans]